MQKIKSPEELMFDEQKHIYTLNGIIIPSVSRILRPLSDEMYRKIDPEVLDRAARRGTAIHNAIENFVKYGIRDIAPEFTKYFDAFLSWYTKHQVAVYATETRTYHKSLMYAGTLDMAARVDGMDTLIDFKSTAEAPVKTGAVQLEAYARALASHDSSAVFDKKMILHLKKDGTYRECWFNGVDMDSWRVYMALLTVRNYQMKEE